MNNDLFFKDCFTEIEDGKVNAELNKATLKCFDSKDNKFSMDCEGNLVVNSIIAREQSNNGLSIDQIYPVGSIYMSMIANNPCTLFGGAWEQIKDRFLLAVGDTYTAVNTTGGEATHTLTINEMPSHSHQYEAYINNGNNMPGGQDKNLSFGMPAGSPFVQYYVTSTGESLPHNNLPPYITCYMWKRVA